MAFMNQEITGLQTWVEIDGTHGITFVPADACPEIIAILDAHSKLGELPEDDHTLFDAAETYYEGDIWEVCTRQGYGARMSAPGYMDCTEWSVFDTAEEAQAFLTEFYADEDEDAFDEGES